MCSDSNEEKKKKLALLNFGHKIVEEATSNSGKKREDTASLGTVTAPVP